MNKKSIVFTFSCTCNDRRLFSTSVWVCTGWIISQLVHHSRCVSTVITKDVDEQTFQTSGSGMRYQGYASAPVPGAVAELREREALHTVQEFYPLSPFYPSRITQRDKIYISDENPSVTQCLLCGAFRETGGWVVQTRIG